jgi:hypothetical protein
MDGLSTYSSSGGGGGGGGGFPRARSDSHELALA